VPAPPDQAQAAPRRRLSPRQVRRRLVLLGIAGLLGAVGAYAATKAGNGGGNQALYTAVATLVAGAVTVLSVAANEVVGRRGGATEVFVAFHPADAAWAKWLAWELERSGYTVIPQTWSFREEADLAARAAEALANSRHVIVLVSQAVGVIGAVGGGAEGWLRALAKVKGGRRRTLLVGVEPVGAVGPAGTRDRLRRTDLVGMDAGEARQAVLGSLHLAGARPDTDEEPSQPPHAMPRYPGQGPRHAYMPPRHPSFTGRDEELAELFESLMSGAATAGRDAPAVQGWAIHGLAGVGKTQLATEFSHRYANHYDIVWWIKADQPAAVVNGLLGLARVLGVAEVSDQEEMLAELWNALRQYGDWLLVFDSAEDEASLSRFWPPTGTGHVLVTSRNPAWSSLTTGSLPLGVLARAEALAFLHRRTQSTDDAALAEIAETLWYLPLALEQAAAYMERTHASPARYSGLLRSELVALMGSGEPPANYQGLVATTWSLCLAKATEEQPAADDLVALAAFFTPDDLPLDLLTRHPDLMPEPLGSVLASQLAYDATVAALTRYSLLATDQERIGLHPLVQAIVRESLDDPERWAALAVRVLEKEFPANPEDDACWPPCLRLLPHVQVATGQALAFGVAGEETGRLLQRAAEYLRVRGEYQDARALLERARSLREELFGPDDPRVAETLYTLSRLALSLAELSEAKALIERARDIHRNTLGTRDPRTAADLSHLGVILRELGEMSEALAVTEQALAIRRGTDPADELTLVGSYDNLGIVLWRLGDYERAREMHERALRIVVRRLGKDRTQVARHRIHLALVLKDEGRLDAARTELERALEVLDGSLGPEHPETIKARTHLADVLRLGAGPGDAAELREQARELFEGILATRFMRSDHPDLACVLCRYAELLRDLAEVERARELAERAERIYRSTNGEDHPYVAEALHRLGVILDEAGEPAAAEAALARAAAIYQARYGQRHPYLAELRRYQHARDAHRTDEDHSSELRA
jgi:tetratricopeptide (TPR) repeat protein